MKPFLSPTMFEQLRLIDCVRFSGCRPARIFTLDVNNLALKGDVVSDFPVSKGAKYKQKRERIRRKHERMQDGYEISEMLTADPRIQVMRELYTEEFFGRFKMGYANYEAGNWPMARVHLDFTHWALGVEDGPSASLLHLLESHSDVAPLTWQGFREAGREVTSRPSPTVSPCISPSPITGNSPWTPRAAQQAPEPGKNLQTWAAQAAKEASEKLHASPGKVSAEEDQSS